PDVPPRAHQRRRVADGWLAAASGDPGPRRPPQPGVLRSAGLVSRTDVRGRQEDSGLPHVERAVDDSDDALPLTRRRTARHADARSSGSVSTQMYDWPNG